MWWLTSWWTLMTLVWVAHENSAQEKQRQWGVRSGLQWIYYKGLMNEMSGWVHFWFKNHTSMYHFPIEIYGFTINKS